MRQISSMAAVVFALFQLLVYFGNVSAKSGTVGLGEYILKEDGKVELYEHSKVADYNSLEAYRASFGDKACNLNFDGQGNIALSYEKDKRCTVDLLTNQEEVFSFVAGLKGSTDELYSCLKAYNSSAIINNLPFMYRLTQAEFDTLETGKHKNQTKCGGDGDCTDTRCKQSEIVWWRDENNVLANVSRAVGNLSASHSEIMKNGEELTFTVTVKDQKECQNEPNNWEITGKNPKSEMKYLLVFHLLPQSSGRIIGQTEEDSDCKLELEITFNSSDYTLLMKGGEPPPIVPTTPSPTSQPSTKPVVQITTKDVKNNITTTKAPEKKKGGSGTVILIVVVLLVLLVVGGVIGYFFVYKKMYAKEAEEGKEDKEKGGEKKDGEGGEAKKDGTATPPSAVPEIGLKTEIGKDDGKGKDKEKKEEGDDDKEEKDEEKEDEEKDGEDKGVKSEGGSQMSKNESVELADKGKKDAADPYAE
ncbi:unnamed protein product [Meloidogyne enterolobii]|uniref:Uncharacterized protein n=1 Tax=Meloidogyne enterolobii TaxID=390850 RepID=A0ACB0Z8C5_MELEN